MRVKRDAYRASLEAAHAASGVVQCKCGGRFTPRAPSLEELELAGWTFAIEGPERLAYRCLECTIELELEPLDRELAAPAIDECDGCEIVRHLLELGGAWSSIPPRCAPHLENPSWRERRCACGCVLSSERKGTKCGACSAAQPALFSESKPRKRKAPKTCKRCRRLLPPRYRSRECVICRQLPLELAPRAEQRAMFDRESSP